MNVSAGDGGGDGGLNSSTSAATSPITANTAPMMGTMVRDASSAATAQTTTIKFAAMTTPLRTCWRIGLPPSMSLAKSIADSTEKATAAATPITSQNLPIVFLNAVTHVVPSTAISFAAASASAPSSCAPYENTSSFRNSTIPTTLTVTSGDEQLETHLLMVSAVTFPAATISGTPLTILAVASIALTTASALSVSDRLLQFANELAAMNRLPAIESTYTAPANL